MNSYQKLKLENEKLKKEIVILLEDNSLEAFGLRTQYKIAKKASSMIWTGSATNVSTTFDRLLKKSSQ